MEDNVFDVEDFEAPAVEPEPELVQPVWIQETPVPAPAPVVEPEPVSEYAYKSSGPAITALQEALADKGFAVETTGTYDKQTRRAVEALQKANGVSAWPAGLVDATVLELLFGSD
jgi:peptidoglycan hydrolase-like protein with peptidoglycan-binding domain